MNWKGITILFKKRTLSGPQENPKFRENIRDECRRLYGLGCTFGDIARQIGASEQTIFCWRKRYEWGPRPRSIKHCNPGKKPRFPEAIKAECGRLYELGYSFEEIVGQAETSVSARQFYGWVKRYGWDRGSIHGLLGVRILRQINRLLWVDNKSDAQFSEMDRLLDIYLRRSTAYHKGLLLKAISRSAEMGLMTASR